MKLQDRILIFSQLGEYLKNALVSNELDELLYAAKSRNQWFTIDNIKLSLDQIIKKYLDLNLLTAFCNDFEIADPTTQKKIGIVAAGNIPLVGFQDILHTILCGHRVLLKASSQDEILVQFFYKKLSEFNPKIKDYWEFVDRINASDAYIATGSGNTSRYFEYYFASKPHIIRKNRTSVAVLSGQETKTDFAALAEDIFQYFGLGCRNVSKLLVPKDYDFVPFFEGIEYYSGVLLHAKFCNNYEYMKSIYLVNRQHHFDNGFVLLKEETSLTSPIAVVYFEYYDDLNQINDILEKEKDNIQVVVNKYFRIKNSLPFGEAQQPGLADFADDVNVVDFLKKL